MIQKSQKYLAIFAILVVLATQCWFVYPVLRHPKLHYWAFLNFWTETTEHTPQTFYTSFLKAVKQVDVELHQDSNFFIDLYGLTLFLTGKRSSDKIWRLKNGWTAVKTEKFPNLEPIESDILNLTRFLQDKQIPFLFVQSARKIHAQTPELPDGAIDYAQASTDAFVNFLRKNHIEVVDCREIFANDPVKHYSLFFHSDNHWVPEYAFHAFRKTALVLQNKYKFKIDASVLDSHNYQRKVVPLSTKPYYGQRYYSERRHVGRFWSKDDEFLLFEPIFQTNMIFEVPLLRIHKVGNCEETWRQSGVYGFQTMKNLQVDEKRIFLIKDSYGIPFFDYLSLICHELIAVDPRNNHESLKKQILENRPDVVIVIFSESSEISLPLE